eukprot:TRINITY_DN6487_c0_g1_i1.p1 TRINITY_DN6487_c0_g1~~TRINITY_DN6487_c0_g1_i1.p1  ORF type:complete len:283 (-),score=38.85 TRINITY_DN6487_c0_g1_i1:104-952(-)
MFVGNKGPHGEQQPQSGGVESGAQLSAAQPAPISVSSTPTASSTSQEPHSFMGLVAQRQYGSIMAQPPSNASNATSPHSNPTHPPPSGMSTGGMMDPVAAGARAEYVDKIRNLPPLGATDRQMVSVCVDLREPLLASMIGVGLTGLLVSRVKVPGFFWKAASSLAVGAAAMATTFMQNEQKCMGTLNRLSDPMWRELFFDMAANKLNAVEKTTLKTRIATEIQKDRITGMPHHLPPPHSRSITLDWIQSQPKRYADPSQPISVPTSSVASSSTSAAAAPANS